MTQLKNPVEPDDDPIQFYLKYLDNEIFKSSEIYSLPPSLSPLLKSEGDPRVLLPSDINQKQVIFIPVNDYEAEIGDDNFDEDKVRGAHWSLLVFSRPDNCFFSLDSANNFNEKASKQLYEQLKGALGSSESPKWSSAVCVQQPNGVDCALYMLANIENLGTHFLQHRTLWNAPVVARDVAAGFRKKVLSIVEELANKTGSKMKSQKTSPRVLVLTPLLFFREELCGGTQPVIEMAAAVDKWNELDELEQADWVMKLKDFKTDKIERFSKAEENLIERLSGLPRRPTSSGFAVFFQQLRLKSGGPVTVSDAALKWEHLPEDQRHLHQTLADNNMVVWVRAMKNFFQTLDSPERSQLSRKRYLKLPQYIFLEF